MPRLVAASLAAACAVSSALAAAAAAGGSIGAVAPDVAGLTALTRGPGCAMVEFYAPWCGHCKSLAPTYEQLGALFNGEGQPTVAKVDATEAGFGDLVAANSVRSFPTLKLFPGSGAAAVDYTGDRTLADMTSFINRHCGSSVEAKEANYAQSPPAAEVSALVADGSTTACVMLEFYAPWCGHCKSLAPTYEGLAQLFNDVPGGPRVLKLDGTDGQYARLAADFGVRGYPTLVLVAPLDPDTGTRERIAYDRRRELADFVDFLNTECGSTVAVPKNFQPPAGAGGARDQAARDADPVLQFAIKFNDFIAHFQFEEGLAFGRSGLDQYPRLTTNVEKTARRVKAVGYRVPPAAGTDAGMVRFLHPLTAAADGLQLIPQPAADGSVPAVTVLMHLELNSPRMKEDLHVMSKLAQDFPAAHFVGITSASRSAGLSKRDRRGLMAVVEVQDSFYEPFAFLKDTWDAVVVATRSREVIWAGGTHQFTADTVKLALERAAAVDPSATAAKDDDGACAVDGCSASAGKETVAEMEAAMAAAAAALDFEKAAALRDRIKAAKATAGATAATTSAGPTPRALDSANIYERDYEEL